MKKVDVLIFMLLSMAVFSCKKGEATTANFRVNSYTVDCVGVGPQKCLLVQEGDLIGTNDWEYFYYGIKGFDYEEGYIYNLNVKQTAIANPLQDASSVEYELIELLSKE
ncbi:MAG: DUF4377 domain-containing protein [Aureispira sp.]|nr:DUF4377 domain-containing protein [Aureispira sp.]